MDLLKLIVYSTKENKAIMKHLREEFFFLPAAHKREPSKSISNAIFSRLKFITKQF